MAKFGFAMRPPCCRALHAPARRHASNRFSDYVLQRRATKSARRLFAAECEDDHALVVRFVRMAKQHLKTAALRRDLLEPLASICDLSARDTPPSDGWEEQLAALALRTDLLAARPVHRTSALISALCERVPRGAHESRLRAALRRVPAVAPAKCHSRHRGVAQLDFAARDDDVVATIHLTPALRDDHRAPCTLAGQKPDDASTRCCELR